SGWNLVGLPLYVDDASYSSLFPGSIDGTLYSFDGGYEPQEYLTPGEGYWLRFPNDGSTTITGTPINELTISLSEGWNLISGLSGDISIYNVDDPYGIVIGGTLYSFSGGYSVAETLLPGNGYWLRADGDGEITLSSGGLARATGESMSLKGAANTLSVHGMDLYFGIELSDEEMLSYSLPPKPPSGSFDVRFTGDTRVVKDHGDIEVMNPGETLTLAYDITVDAGDHMSWVLRSDAGEEYVLDKAGEMVVPSSARFTLERRALIPVSYTLHQNYPNPFNPVTTLRYDLPDRAHVILSVYDLAGREVTRLVNGVQEAGFRSVRWDATDRMGRPVSAGIYFYRIEAGEYIKTMKMLLLK
ncbi:MAG TPA: T9SS type A sorting domain-containing protein, partial [Candidatus Marinimicrobia bacterium]|nr:T9SS type A sorting domain-containing protein [Candidatus Neomarinimicrobiota bacterium]